MAVNNLSPYQLAIQNAVGKGKGAGALVTPEIAGRAADSIFGPAPITPGSQILYQDAQQVQWIDPEGYTHQATRSLDGRDPNAGRWQINTNRPNVLPNQQQQGVTQALGQQVQQAYTTPLALAQLDPETAARLQAIYQSQQAANAQNLADQQGQLLAGLYGNRVNQSSIANEAAARFAQYAGLVNQQTAADAATRELQARQYLTGIGQQRNEAVGNLYNALSGQGTQRDIANAGYNLDYARLAEQARQANQGFELGQQQADTQLAQQRSTLNRVLQGINAASGVAGAIGGGLSAYS